MRILISIFLFFSLALSAQNSFIKSYARSVNPQNEDVGAGCIDQVGTSDYVIGGGTFSSCTPGPLLFRVDAQGNVIWDTIENFNTTQACWFVYVEGTNDDGFLALDDKGNLYKFDSNNGLQWKIKTECASSTAQFHAKLIEQPNGYVIAGLKNQNGTLVKVDLAGNPVFARLFRTGTLDATILMGLKQTSDGGFIAAGYTLLNGNDASVYLVKTDNMGNYLWSKAYSKNGTDDYGMDIVIMPDGGFLICDASISPSKTILLKTDSLGNLQWAKDYAIGNYPSPSSLVNTGSRVVVKGSNSKPFLVEVDSSGAWRWTHTYLPQLYGTPTVVRTASDGGFATTYCSGAYVPGRPGLIKTDSLGDISGVCGDSSLPAPVITDVTSQFVTTSTGNVPTGTIAVGALGNFLADDTVQSNIECPGSLTAMSSVNVISSFSVYPVPSDGRFTLSFEREGLRNAEVIDVFGRTTAEFSFRDQKEEIDLSVLSKGIYFVKVTDWKGIFSLRKIVIE